jgi:hypothetical protein
MMIRRLGAGNWAILAAAGAVLVAGALRYAHQPTFWLDEAFVAASLRNPSPRLIFAPLEYGQYFPRLYLSCIALLRYAAGYQIWVLRLLPFLSFVIATLLWARLLARRTRGILVASLLAGGLLLGGGYWLDQAIQLKQYTFDVMLALIPFLLSDRSFDEGLAEGRRKTALVLFVSPFAFSYTYPLVLGARVLGWYLSRGREGRWRLSVPAVSLLGGLALLGLVCIWATDYRFNLERGDYLGYWDDCILSSHQSFSSTLRLLAKFFWGWHGKMALLTAVVAPLQVLGVYRVLNRYKKPAAGDDDRAWGSRSLGSLFLMGGVILASMLFSFPICAGRVVLFVQVHTQILAIEGALWILAHAKQRVATAAMMLVSGIAIVYGVGNYWRIVNTEPAENLRPALSLIKRDIANTVWVHPCSVAQVRALPDPLPVEQVVFGSSTETPEPGARVWIIWSHMGGGRKCARLLDRVRSQAKTWELVHSGPDSGLALAQF